MGLVKRRSTPGPEQTGTVDKSHASRRRTLIGLSLPACNGAATRPLAPVPLRLAMRSPVQGIA
jgi:hypothetical protein